MQEMTFGFFTNLQKQSAVDGLLAGLKKALSLGYSCCIDEQLLPLVKDLPTMSQQPPDVILAFGGDGTILRAASRAAELGVPILGINLGRVGFLSEITPDQLEAALVRIDQGDYSVDKRMMFECRVNGGAPHYCLNETLLYKRSFSGIVDISTEINGVNAGSVMCDGIIISTTTGATGYSISAGGPVITPGFDVAIITPICPHTLSFRPIIAPADAQMCFSMNSEGYISLDGIYTMEINQDDKIVVYRSERYAAFVKFEERNIYSLIRSKLSQHTTQED